MGGSRVVVTRRTRLILALLTGAVLPGAGAAPGEARATKFTGDRLPVPPRQRGRWTPPRTELPPAFVAATTALFNLGLADPRGCAYREVDVAIHFLRGGMEITPTRGWVLPADGPGGRFVVCWNGLVYPATRVGPLADLAGDVHRAIAADGADSQEEGDEHPSHLRFRTFDPTGAVTEAEAVSHQTIMPLKACLLLRLGEEGLARKLWGRWVAGLEKVNNNAEYVEKPYIVLAENWTWHLFDRALTAHIAGDDGIALLSARALASVQGRAAAMADTLGVQRYTTEAVRGTLHVEGSTVSRSFQTYDSGKKRPLFVIEPADLRPLLADQERRAVEPLAPAGRPAGAAGVAALIRDLQEISVPQRSQPGYPDLAGSPTVKALIARGDDAVEPLLDALEKDDRLTRTVTYWRDFSTDRDILGVSEAAQVALAYILDDEPFEAACPDPKLQGRARLAAGARACWRKAKGVPIEGRWYRALADDGAGPDRWLRAAWHMVESTPAGAARGEPLRGRAGPTVAGLMARRAGDLARRPAAAGADPGAATRMALLLARWDAAAAVPTLRFRMTRLQAELAEPRPKPGPKPEPKFGEFPPTPEDLGDSIAMLTLARARGSDPGALAEYADWLRATPPKLLAGSLPGALAPLWVHPGHPAIAAATAWLCDDPQSPWARRLGTAPDVLSTLASSPLLGVAAFRAKVLAALADTSRAGAVTLTASGTSARRRAAAAGDWYAQVSIALDSGGGGLTAAAVRGPLGFELGAAVPFRVGDYLAHELAGVGGFPDCELFWPRPRRDESVAACSAFLRRYGERLGPVGEAVPVPLGRADGRWPELNFPKLDHPATPDEVGRGLAIFSLAGEGEARVVALPRRPLRARWGGPRGATGVLIWQAEEVRAGGAWRRYYGILAPHALVRAPADQVEPEPEPDADDRDAPPD